MKLNRYKRDRYTVDVNGCWIWQMAFDKRGAYGRWGKRQAHRRMYELLVGSIPEGLQIDHLCRVTQCVNPAHLEPVTAEENHRRRFAALTHCRQGHAYDETNTYFRPDGLRDCRACIRDRVKRYKQRLRERQMGEVA